MEEDHQTVQVELSVELLCQLLRERYLVASDFRSLNTASSEASKLAVKKSLFSK